MEIYLKIKDIHRIDINKKIASFIISDIFKILKEDKLTIEEFSKKVPPENVWKLLSMTLPTHYFNALVK